MEKSDQLQTPVIVEDDGWTLASGSQDRPSEAQLRQALGAEPRPPGETPPPDAPPPDADVQEPPVEEPPVEEPPTEPGEEPTEPAEPAAPSGKRKQRHDPQKRFDRLHADLASERDKRLRLERELAELRRPTPPPARGAEPPPPIAAAAAPAAALPKPVWGGTEGYEAQGKTWEEYETDKEAWTIQAVRADLAKTIDERLAQERTRLQTEAQTNAQDAAYLARVDELRRKRPDYDRVVENLGSLDSPELRHLIYWSSDGPAIGLHLAEHLDQAETLVGIKWSRPVVDALRRSPVTVKLLEHFALHPEDVETLTRQDPVSAIAAIGRLEARLDVDPSVTTRAARSVTSARPPLRTVGGGAQVPARAAATSPPDDDLPFGPEYILRGNQAEAARRERLRGY